MQAEKLMLVARELATLAAQDADTCVPVTAAAAKRRGTDRRMMPYDVFVSHAKRCDSSEDRAVWCADILEQHGLVAFYDRTDLKEITEPALLKSVIGSQVGP
jgi:hypothetical protein